MKDQGTKLSSLDNKYSSKVSKLRSEMQSVDNKTNAATSSVNQLGTKVQQLTGKDRERFVATCKERVTEKKPKKGRGGRLLKGTDNKILNIFKTLSRHLEGQLDSSLLHSWH